MGVIRFFRECRPDDELARLADAPALRRRVVVRPLVGPAEREALVVLAAASAAPAAGATFQPAGLVGELASREGREIIAWLAWDGPACGEPSGEEVLPGAVGFVALNRTRSGWSIPWLLVHPRARRLGVGRRLVAHAIAHARSRGAAGVSAETLDTWTAAGSFWESIGFGRR